MTCVVGSITFDCADPHALAQFWSAVTGFAVDEEGAPGDQEVGLTPPDGHPMLLFIRVPEDRRTKNRLHLDVLPAVGTTREDEVQRLRALGASVVDDRRRPDGRGWVVMADPEGNELCVERGEHERSDAVS